MVSWNISVLIVLILMKDEAQCLQYNFGDGSYYVGSVDNQGRPSGRGQYHNSSGDLEYEGEFLSGLRHGQGTQYNPDGSVFQGQFEFGYPQGFGAMQRPNGDRIEGEFRNGHPHGKIVIKLAGKKDHRIEGQFRHGMAHGRLRLYHGQKSVYEGFFRMGKPHDAAKVNEESEIPDNLHFKRLRI